MLYHLESKSHLYIAKNDIILSILLLFIYILILNWISYHILFLSNKNNSTVRANPRAGRAFAPPLCMLKKALINTQLLMYIIQIFRKIHIHENTIYQYDIYDQNMVTRSSFVTLGNFKNVVSFGNNDLLIKLRSR